MKTAQALDVARLRQDFPALALKVHGKPLVYLDNAATSQKPRQVLDAERTYYETMNANVHRGVHTLSERATEAYEGARGRIEVALFYKRSPYWKVPEEPDPEGEAELVHRVVVEP